MYKVVLDQYRGYTLTLLNATANMKYKKNVNIRYINTVTCQFIFNI